MCIDMSIDIHVAVVDGWQEKKITAEIKQMAKKQQMVHVFSHVCRYVCRHVYRHVYQHVYRHV